MLWDILYWIFNVDGGWGVAMTVIFFFILFGGGISISTRR